MNTEILEKLENIIYKHKNKLPQELNTDEIKELCNKFALALTDEEILDYLSMMEYSMSEYDFRILMIEIYESL